MAQRPFLFLVIDAIPYDLARRAWKHGALKGFSKPRPMISVFPSLTNVAVGGLLRGVFDDVPVGYEARYLDLDTGKLRGGFHDPESEAAMAHLHGRPKGLLAHAALYVLRTPLVHDEVRRITQHFLEEGRPWLAYVPATDGVAHFDGSAGLERVFRDICKTICALREEHRRRTGVLPGVVMCSDHGMTFGRFAHLSSSDLDARLRDAGFHRGARRADGFVLTPYGDVGGGVVYADPARAPEVAEVVANAPGVDVAFGIAGEGCTVVSANGGRTQRGWIGWRSELYKYQALAGDPLGYARVWQLLEQQGQLEDGWVRDRDLLEATRSHLYPDALARVRHAMVDMVRMPASVLFSMKPTWTYGPALTHAAAALMGGQVGTHGALSAGESVGFAACTAEDEPSAWAAPALRPHEVLRPWRELVRAGRADIARA